MKIEDIAIVIPSKGRPETVEKIYALLPTARFCIAESEVGDYKIPREKGLLVHPDSLKGIVPKRQWILDVVKEKCVFQCDDDIYEVIALTGYRPRKITDPNAVFRIIMNSASICESLGLGLFGFTSIPKPLYAPDNRPFAFCSVIMGAFGIIGRDLHYDQKLVTREDADITLQGLARYRVNWIDTRFCFNGEAWDNIGGLQSIRSKEQEERDMAYMKSKWGSHCEWKTGAKEQSKRNHLSLHVTRTSTSIK